ncbi:putative aspartyl protease [Chryseobacterium sp. H1D6B]|uniref:retropepsin-like aspartic protease n=1 Tax=Chryseobacterium sp. H1D6B TaxID=2940588 RepID=UPI0015CD587C|nr:retropepsin-like aspartic protease [Chryseobacterium sp. H1D6B]MDH6253519.1 putative aspartyl protease [Chryseobacterium sp. H1D6B]
MKKILYLFFAFYIITISGQGKKFFETGEVILKNPVEKINLKYTNQLPFVQVSINGKSYNFLFDSGAPTVISSAVYKELNLEKLHKSKVKDSQKNKQEQIFTELPEMIVDNVVFKNIGAIVMDFTVSEMECFKMDGIIGANQMAKLFWRVNYSENSLETSKDLSNFDLNGYDIVFPFEAKPQKTPVIETKILNKKIILTFDTGFSGRLKADPSFYDPKNAAVKGIQTYGTNAVGAFGGGKPETGSIFKLSELSLGNKDFPNQIIMTGNSNLIGNEFLKDFTFILDWKNNKIYLKRIKNDPPKLESFGFGYRFIDAKPVVVFVFEDKDLPIKIGDSILSIDAVDLDHLNEESACSYFINRVEKDKDVIDIKIKRDGAVLDFKLNKKEYLK